MTTNYTTDTLPTMKETITNALAAVAACLDLYTPAECEAMAEGARQAERAKLAQMHHNAVTLGAQIRARHPIRDRVAD